MITLDATQLDDVLVSQAKLAFIENAIGTSFDDTLTGNNLGNELKGNAGNDQLKGLGGDDVIKGGDGTDTVLFTGSKGDYEIKREGDYVVFKDKVAGRDGVDKVYNVEKVGFGVAAAVDMDSLLPPIVAPTTAQVVFDREGFYTFFAELSSAVYIHTGVGNETTPSESNGLDYDNYQKLLNTKEFSFLTHDELNLSQSGQGTTVWLKDVITPTNTILLDTGT